MSHVSTVCASEIAGGLEVASATARQAFLPINIQASSQKSMTDHAEWVPPNKLVFDLSVHRELAVVM